ncbi:MAG: hypothetical protein J5822_07050 [Eubacteriaceae bacterium]|nr:hypothetical protein [Eubacteriaceae bacterium]
MKKTVIVLIAAVMLVAAASCGSGGGPLDLTGNWEESPQNELYMSAHIEEGVIEVYWMFDGEKILYWAGTYDPPRDNPKEYSWVSKNDKVKTGNAMMGSTKDTKEFSYSNDTLTFEISQNGELSTVELKRTDTDYSEGFIPSVSGTLEDKGSPEIVDSGYTVLEGVNTVISYGVVIRNPSPDLAMMRPVITVRALAEKGYVLHEYTLAIAAIAAGDTIFFGQDVSYTGPVPAKVEITVTNEDKDFMYQADNGPVYLKDLAIRNTFMKLQDGMPFFTGDITNNTQKYMDNVMLVVIYYDADGSIVGGTLGSVRDLAPGQNAEFEVIDYYSDEDYGVDFSTFQIYGLEW